MSYKYLGVHISYNGSLNLTIKDRLNKATKCIYAVKNALSHTTNISVKVALSIFDKQIAPILLYGSPLWSLPNINSSLRIYFEWEKYPERTLRSLIENFIGSVPEISNVSLNKNKRYAYVTFKTWQHKQLLTQSVHRRPVSVVLEDVGPSESYDVSKIHAKYLKFVLGVSKFTSNNAVFRELGQSSIHISGVVNAVTYYHRISCSINTENDKLLWAAFKSMKSYSHPWVDKLHYVFAKNGLENVFQTLNNYRKGAVKRLIKTRLHDVFRQGVIANLKSAPHLKYLHMLTEGTSFESQGYLSKIDSPQIRTIFTKIRTNGTPLNVAPYIEVENLCPSCERLRDFQHILMECTLHKSNLETFISRASHHIPGIRFWNRDKLFCRIMKLELNKEIIPLAITLVSSAYRAVQRS